MNQKQSGNLCGLDPPSGVTNLIWCSGFTCVSCVLLSARSFVHGVVCLFVPDECEEVEQQVQKVVQEMENILGEPLQSYF